MQDGQGITHSGPSEIRRGRGAESSRWSFFYINNTFHAGHDHFPLLPKLHRTHESLSSLVPSKVPLFFFQTRKPPFTQPSITMADEATKQKLRSTFDKLTPEDFASVAGNKDGLADKVAEKYGISKEEATKQVNEAFSK